MVEYLDNLIAHIGLLGLLVLGLAAAVEYVVPPFPGDTITLLGGVYAGRCASVGAWGAGSARRSTLPLELSGS